MDKNYRIHTNIASDTILNVNMTQDYDFLEVLTMKLRQKDAYKLHSSNYGVIIGRVLANDAFGIPNAKISVFIERDTNDSVDIENIYPYSDVTSKDKDGRRYNLLPDYSDDDCYRIVGTFPNKRLLLDNDIQLEIYDKYWKYTTVTNNAGDYMIFGVPSGNQQIHVDIDLSDIGILSQKPRDFEYKGYNLTMFDNPNQFKESTNLESLAQLFSQDKSVFVYPFWGDADNGVAAITRADIQIQYKFEPTCVFMGSIVSDNEGNSIGHKCAAEIDNGMNNQLIAGEGTIEMIRKTTDGLIEEYQIQGNQLINENGVWCYQIPMNLDFVGTDEYGNIVPTDNPNKGIPTRTQVRFRISKNETSDEGFSRHTAKYLVPMNPIFDETKVRPTIKDKGQEVEKLYNFGSNTPESCFRDLYWNNVYSVKNYIPKVQVAHRPYSKNYSALKGANLVDDQNPIPFNKLRIDIPFMYMIVCILFTIVMYVVMVVNALLSFIHFLIYEFCLPKIPLVGRICPFGFLEHILGKATCISLGGGLSEDNTAYFPGCSKGAMKDTECPSDMEDNCNKSSDESTLLDKVQQKLAQDYKIVKLDFYQDWLNGSLYMPLWHWRKRKKKTFLFFTLSRAKNEFCDCDKSIYSRLKTYVTCNVSYNNISFGTDEGNTDEGEKYWHRSRGKSRQVGYFNGLIKGVENKNGLTAYYYAAVQATRDNNEAKLDMSLRTKPFLAVRLYATDIILLGNLNENNLYGIPQFFKALPSTTANIPPIAVIQENNSEDESKNYSENEAAGGEDSGVTITTGMDWGHDGDEHSPMFKDGLFMDLACTYAHTKAKSCFNVERLSELGVNLDSSYYMSYAVSNEIERGAIDSDGFVTKYELDDMENRAMFATMNHIGFVPQTYQDSISGYTTQVEDKNTNYLIPKFKYIYPVDFDGRMQPIMERYKNGFQQSQFDDIDQSYITFRMGAESDSELEEKRIRHFYYNKDAFEMPLYNNSYYFYFGIKKGNTAIDKFNEMFYSQCFKNDKKPFSLDIDTRGKSYCPTAYKEGHKDEAYGYIRVKSDDIRMPYSYTLYDAKGNVVISEENMNSSDFVIGGTVNDNGDVACNDNGAVKYQLKDAAVDNEYGRSGLTNQEYILDITDSYGKVITEKVKLDMGKIEFEYETRNLGTKFYNTKESRIGYICNDTNNFFGVIKITRFFVDTYEFEITEAKVVSDDSDDKSYVVSISGGPKQNDTPIGSVTAYFKLYAVNKDSDSVKDCLCDSGNSIPNKDEMSIATATQEYYIREGGTNFHAFEFYVYQPNAFVGEISQFCDGKLLEENTTTQIIKIQNGANFNTYLNTMPTRFIIGTTSDSISASIGNTSNFYHSSLVEDPRSNGLKGWFGVHQEDAYQFHLSINTTAVGNEKVWSDFVSINTNISDVNVRKRILRYKFEKMFKLSNTVYVTSRSSSTFRYTATGGASPYLYRSLTPYYGSSKKTLSRYLYSEDNSITLLKKYPNVVGNNYKDPPCDNCGGSPRFNTFYSCRQTLGNYFAAFTSNGRYTGSSTGDCSINIQQLPNYAAVNLTDEWKRLGRDAEISACDLPTKVYKASSKDGLCQGKSTLPYLRALFVDRRLDYEFNVLGPVQGKTFSLYSGTTEEEKKVAANKDMVWKSSRISGFTYNGIEMAYDLDYNVISATSVPDYYTIDGDNSVIYTDYNDALRKAQLKYPKTQEETIDEYSIRVLSHITTNDSITNNRLEYSYSADSFSGSNAITIYNSGATDSIWQSDNGTQPIIKMLYRAELNDKDIRNYFWSSFNKNRLSIYTASQGNIFSGTTYYVYNHNMHDDTYNGDFNMESAVSGNYPTKRLLDIGNISQSNELYLDFVSCSYGMNPELTADGVITCEAREGEENEIYLTFEEPIKIINPNPDNKDYGNIMFVKTRRNQKKSGITFYEFSGSKCSISFNYNLVSNDNFNIYTLAPVMIKVLPYINDVDGITYYKTASGNTSIDKRIQDISMLYFGRVGEWGDIEWAWWFNTIVKNDVYLDDNKEDTPGDADGQFKHFFKGGDKLPSDDNDFGNILFRVKDLDLVKDGNHVDVFTILVRRDYESQDGDYLTKFIRTYETSTLFDARPILFGISPTPDSVSDSGETYAQKLSTGFSGGEEKQQNSQGGNDNNNDSNEDEPISVSGSGQVYIQTITFYMATPSGITYNSALSDFSSMGYTFKFSNNSGDNYYLSPEKVEAISPSSDTELIVRFQIKFTQDMGILADNVWSDGAKVTVLAKAPSGFTYKLNEFKLTQVKQSDQQGGYDPSSKTSPDDWKPGTSKQTKVSIAQE